MRIAQVIGPVWGARHADGLHGRKILALQTQDGGQVCAVDALGAGPGEWVLVAHGSRVRNLTVGEGVADKDIVVAILDGMDLPSLPSLASPPSLAKSDASNQRGLGSIGSVSSRNSR